MDYIIQTVSRDTEDNLVGAVILWQADTDEQGNPLYDWDLKDVWEIMRMIKAGHIFKVHKGNEVYIYDHPTKGRILRSDSTEDAKQTLNSLAETKFKAN